MQDQSVSSSGKLRDAKIRLKNALTRLERLIQEQENSLQTERGLRTQVIKDLDSHIAKLETILKEE